MENLTEKFKHEHLNFLRYYRLVIEFGAQKILEILERHLQDAENKSFEEWLADNKEAFYDRLKKPVRWVWNTLYPETCNMEKASLDITVLKTIFVRLLDTFPEPQNGWDGHLDPNDHSEDANILRIVKLRNGPHIAHNATCQLKQQHFEEKWRELDPGSERKISRLKVMQPLS